MFTFRTTVFTWAWKRRSSDKVNPKGLCLAVLATGCPQKLSLGMSLLHFLLKVCVMVFDVLNVIANCFPQFSMTSRSFWREFSV